MRTPTLASLAVIVSALEVTPASTAARPHERPQHGCGVLIDTAHPWHSHVPGGNTETGDHWITARDGRLSTCAFAHLAIHRLLALPARTYPGRDVGRLVGGVCNWAQTTDHETIRPFQDIMCHLPTPRHRHVVAATVRNRGPEPGIHPLARPTRSRPDGGSPRVTSRRRPRNPDCCSRHEGARSANSRTCLRCRTGISSATPRALQCAASGALAAPTPAGAGAADGRGMEPAHFETQAEAGEMLVAFEKAGRTRVSMAIENSPSAATFSPRWWPRSSPPDRVVERLVASKLPSRVSRFHGQWLDPLAGGCLGESVALGGVGDQGVGVVHEPVDGRGRDRLGSAAGWVRPRAPTDRMSCRLASPRLCDASRSSPGRDRRPPRRAARGGPRWAPSVGWWRSRSRRVLIAGRMGAAAGAVGGRARQ